MWVCMRLIRMVLRGFKSFAEKTEIEFADGVTAIVGPNGSGKSNIADAVRWVLGEQNVRQLRGEKSADIIFAGTETERAKASAEVTLVFDNIDETLMPDVAEVSVTRRLLRSGTSEYFINKQACRLKDIQLLFADTGLGRDSMAVIGQNRVDRILIGRPEERKLIFEEVAGITGFKIRKAEGLRKLTEAERNMERVQDIATVLEAELGSMETRAKELQTYLQLEREKKELKATLLWQQYKNAQKQLTRIENEYFAAADKVTQAQSALAKIEAERQARLYQTEKENTELRRLEQEAAQAAQSLQRVEGEYQVACESERYLQERLDSIMLQETELRTQYEKWETVIQTQRDECNQAARLWEDALRVEKETEREVVTSQEEQEAYLAYEKEREQKQSAHKERLLMYEKSLELSQQTREWLLQEIEKQQPILAQLQAEKEQLASKLREEKEQYEEWVHDKAERQSRLVFKQQQWKIEKEKEDVLRKSEQERENQCRELENRYRYLEKIVRDREGFTQATKTVLQSTESWRRDCIGTVADVLDVPARYTTAIDVALGGALQHIIVERVETAQQVIEYLKKRHAGRTTFYPLQAIQSRGLGTAESAILREDGVIGTADNCVHYDQRYRPVVAYLLGRTVVVQNMDRARELAKAYRYRVRMVTLDGQLFLPGGSVTGGSTRKAEVTFFGQKQELSTLREQITKLQKPVLVEWPDVLTAEAEVNALSEKIHELDLRMVTLQTRIQEEATYLEKQDERIFMVTNAKEAYMLQLAENDRKIEATKEAWEKEKAGFVVPAGQLAPDESKLAVWQEKLTACRVAVAENKLKYTQSQAMLAEAETSCQQVKAQQSDLAEKKKEEEANLSTQQTTISRLRDEHAQWIRTARETKVAAERYFAEREERIVATRELETVYEQARQVEREAQIALACLEEKTHHMKAACELRLQEVHDLGFTADTIEAVLQTGSMQEIRGRLAQTEETISQLGPVNPNAIEEYESARVRHELYETQLNDMKEARNKLQQVVKDIDRTMEMRFREAFDVIAVEFQRIFTHLFGGGEAKLELTAENEAGVGGVEIYIQPPGKKQQSLTLLSGGERALTVIALLFSFMAYRPAPFCLVDEVDAALDDANVMRFRNYLKDGRNNMQFIVITHRKITMEAADVLQGVTMERKGISRMIEIDLKRYEEA